MKVVAPLVRKVDRWLREQAIRVESMVVAVSGGPDSVALLRALLALRLKDAQGPLIIAHLNHQLRGAESDDDEAFVCRLHQELAAVVGAGLEFCCERVNVTARAEAAGANVEAMGRKIRYDWLARIAREKNARWIATGHTTDDQAETVLHRLLRGAGLQGLRGIAARRELAPGIELIRPLLEATRAELLAYLASESQAYRLDRSNLDLAYTRNRIRHELLPLLVRDYNPAIATLLGRLAEQAEEVHREQEARARQLLREAELPRAGAVLVFDRQQLAAASRHLIREMFRLVWVREGWPVDGMSFDHWDRVAAVVLGDLPVAELPGGLLIRSRERVVQVGTAL